MFRLPDEDRNGPEAGNLALRAILDPDGLSGPEALSLMDACWVLVNLAYQGEDIRPYLSDS